MSNKFESNKFENEPNGPETRVSSTASQPVNDDDPFVKKPTKDDSDQEVIIYKEFPER